MERLTVAIADDHPAIRRGVRKVLEKMPGVVVVGEAKDGLEAIEVVEKTAPDLLILDIQMPVMDGIEVLKTLHAIGFNILILVFSAIDDPFLRSEVLAMGACLFVLKSDVQSLIQGVRQVRRRECEQDRSRFLVRGNARVF